MESRVCFECKRELPATKEFFEIDKRKLLGLGYRCRQCRRKYYKKYKKEHPEKYEEFYEKNKEKLIKRTTERANKISRVRKYSYKYLHTLIKKKKPKPLFCFICNEFLDKLELSSINHTYTDKPNDYIWLCKSCHILLDKLSRKRGVIIEY